MRSTIRLFLHPPLYSHICLLTITKPGRGRAECGSEDPDPDLISFLSPCPETAQGLMKNETGVHPVHADEAGAILRLHPVQNNAPGDG